MKKFIQKEVEKMECMFQANLAWKDGIKNLNGYSLPKEVLKQGIENTKAFYGEFIPVLAVPLSQREKFEVKDISEEEILCYISNIDVDNSTCIVHTFCSNRYELMNELNNNFIGLNYEANTDDNNEVKKIIKINSAEIVKSYNNIYDLTNIERKVFKPHKYLIIREKDTVEVLLVRKKLEDKYQFINLTKGHICPCEFNTVQEAIEDLVKYREEGKILKFVRID